MKNCPFCNQQLADDASFCTHCGNQISQGAAAPSGQPQYNQQAQYIPQPVVAPSDHTAEFSSEDVHAHKLLALLIYGSSIIGIVVALLSQSSGKSDYLTFHIKQGLKLMITDFLVSALAVLLCWTCIAIFAGIIAGAIVSVARVICFIQTCRNKSVEPIIIRSLKFLD